MTSYKDAFVEAFSDIAFDVAKTTGISAQVVLGQAALESGWGRHAPGNNLHGIKGQGQTLATKEDYGKGKVGVSQSFKTFDKPEDSFTHWGGMMTRMDRYGPVRDAATVKQEIAALGKSGYATDKNYKSSLAAAVSAVQATPAFQDKAVAHATSQIEPAEPNFDGVLRDQGYKTYADGAINPVHAGTVEVSDLAPISSAPTGFDPSMAGSPASYGEEQAWGGYTPDYAAQPDYSDISAGMYGSPAFPGSRLESFTPNEAATPDFSGAMPQSNFDAIQDQAFPGASFNMGAYAPDPGLSVSPIGASGWGEYAGVSPSDFQSGIHAGVTETTPTPDFSAPSLAQRQQDMVGQENIDNFEKGNWAQPQSLDIDKLNASLMAELAQQTPTAVPTQVASLAPVAAATELPALPTTSVAPVRQAPSVAPVQRAPSPVQQAPVRIERAPTLPTATLPQTSFPQSAPTPPERPTGSYQGFGTVDGAMNAIGAGLASMPEGYNQAWGATAFADSPYAGAAWNSLQDAVSKQAGFDARKSVIGDMPGSLKGAALGGVFGGPIGMIGGAAIGGLKDMGVNMNPFSGLGSFFSDVFGTGGYSGPYEGQGRVGETYSNEQGFNDIGGWGTGSLAGMGFDDGSAYGGPPDDRSSDGMGNTPGAGGLY